MSPNPRGGGPGPPGGPSGPDQEGPGRNFSFWYIILGALLLAAIYWVVTREDRIEIGYGHFREIVREGKVESCVLKPDEITGELRKLDTEGRPIRVRDIKGQEVSLKEADTHKFSTIWSHKDEDIYTLLDDNDVEYSEQTDQWQTLLMFWVLPILVIFLLWRFLYSRMNNAGGIMNFARSQAKMFMQKEGDATFDDVAGIEECKEELQEVVEFLKDPDKFTRLGGTIPKGVLLVGEPGTGKTLLARAVAGEAEVPFFSLSGSDFVEMFVGVGAARVRDLFKQANQHAPCIIFIDELDALGKARGSGMMGGHEEREQTLNALLVQMDGFEPTKGIILLGATNRPGMLDPALLRAGRFDRQITVPHPDLKGRQDILALHTREIELDDSVDLRKIAALTSGFVGADLANLVNESALLAARRDKEAVGMSEFQESIERVVAGLERRNRLMNSEEKRIVAHHESGHALIACLVPGADPVRKVSMVARGGAGLGFTMQMPLEDRYLLRKYELVDRLAVMLAGRAAEEVVFDEISTGASDDLAKATEMARRMVLDYGMSDEIGPLSYPRERKDQDSQPAFLGKPWSEHTNREMDEAVKGIVCEAHDRALDLIVEHRDALDSIAAKLTDKEVLEQEELQDILEPFGIEIDRHPAVEQEEKGDEKIPETTDE
ncbi:MAG: ATP-dependent zinc metalloprotease FtsH [Candidatus Brocadiia bacterium]